MAETFIPDLLSPLMLAQLDKVLVARAITNSLWEGEIKQAGDSVKIWTPGDITIKNYTKDTDHATPDATTGTDQTMTIDQQKYFNFQVDTISIAQMPVPVLAAYIERAAYALKDTIDQHVLGLYTGVDSSITVTPSATLSTSNIHTVVAELYRKMDENNIPKQGRFLVVHPRVVEIINLYLAGRSTQLGDAVNVNGYVGNFMGFNIYESNNVVDTDENMTGTSSTETVYNCLAGTNMGITFAMQIPEGNTRIYVPELRFATAVKSLIVYGSKMLGSGKRNGLLKAWFSN